MENYINNIELIDQYVNGLLSSEALASFEERLQYDGDFNSLYQEHLVMLGGMDRVALRAEMAKGYQAYKLGKWLKVVAVSVFVAIVSTVLFVVLSKSGEREETPKSDTTKSIIDPITEEEYPKEKVVIALDSIQVEKASNVGLVKDSVQVEIVTKTSKQTYKLILKEAEIIVVNTAKDTVIVCREGTRLRIKANSFVYKNSGRIVNGNVNLKVSEYYELADMLLANLTTRSHDEQLETGGMLHLEAFQNGKALELKNGVAIEIGFPKKGQKDGMQLFSGKVQGDYVNWEVQPVIEEIVSVEEVEEVDIEVPFSVIEQAPIFPGCETKGDDQLRRECFHAAIKKHVQRYFNTDIAAGLGITGRQRIMSIFKISKHGEVQFVQSSGAHPLLEEEANRVIGLLPKMIPGKQRGRAVAVPYSFPILFSVDNEKVEGFGVRDTALVTTEMLRRGLFPADTIYTKVRGVTEKIREIMKDKDFVVDSAFVKEWRRYEEEKLIREFGWASTRKVMLRKPLFEMRGSRFKILENDSITRGGHVIRIPLDSAEVPSQTVEMELVPKAIGYIGGDKVSAEVFEKRVDDSTDDKVTSKDVSYYVLRTANLGWINCDRFVKSRGAKVKFKLKIKNSEEANVNMVFNDYNSVLPGWKANDEIDFGTVSKNEDITIVAIKRDGGKLYFDAIETNTSETNNIILDFKEVSIAELKAYFEDISLAF
ncbi:hypothetical protein [Mangrovimonas sp. YM274]|uniref:hypothetical protein n=1 Tax=Mangrovimonas sp. YM274 TaxID=3070660 RepID=UPI0027DCF365|nr:hypothetical protein [Mangrovimonas sp. YM274]WMI68837.1 hypothetical protein RBH95_00375 [Mangrovimonas sp. YM274]